MVSLNWRTLLNPAAKAMSETFMAVETSRVRAVWARLARARDSGPAPSSWLRIRLSWREEYPSRAASPSTPSRLITPSLISRMARPAISERTFQAGVPGTASGRQRLHAR
ncbi:hypothetical protein SRABI128_05634 [Microbacterium sp. Bi128]|nr:hypothetical protein SRABI128_05634 [Microbacterium sp. Bi128]